MGKNILVVVASVLLLSGCCAFRSASHSPVNEWLSQATPVIDDAEGSLNPYVLKVIDGYRAGTYPYYLGAEYEIYNGVSEDLWYRDKVVAKAYPDRSHVSYCCGLTYEVFFRAMRLRNQAKGVDSDDFNSMNFEDLFNLLQLWYIEGEGDSPALGIVSYGLGRYITDWEEAKPGDFGDFSRNNKSGHSVIFVNWVRDEEGEIIGLRYFSSNLAGAGYLTEYFSDTGGKVLREWLRLARVGSIEEYRPFDRSQIPQRDAYAATQPKKSNLLRRLKYYWARHL